MYVWESGGSDKDGDEGGLASAALLAARSPGAALIPVRALAVKSLDFANCTTIARHMKIRVVGYCIPLMEEMKKRLHFEVDLPLLRFDDVVSRRSSTKFYLYGIFYTNILVGFIFKSNSSPHFISNILPTPLPGFVGLYLQDLGCDV